MFRIGVWIFIITIALMYNTYKENAILDLFKKNKKYIKMAGIAFTGISLYAFIQKFPTDTRDLMLSSSNVIRFMPIDKSTKTALYNMTQAPSGYKEGFQSLKHRNSIDNQQASKYGCGAGRSGSGGRVKRSVSESKKKYVAANQNWRCGHCKQQLDATYEIDHVIELQNGGTNDVSNLKALCRNCHGKKTMMTRMSL